MEFTKEWLHANSIAISCDNEEEAEDICRIFGSNKFYFIKTSNIYLPYTTGSKYSESLTTFTTEEFVIKSFSRITFIPSSEVIASYEASKQTNKKIIGYKVPFDLYRGDIKKGSIATQSANYDFWEISGLSITIQLPPEIVKTWEPVYEEKKPVFGSFEDVINSFKDSEYIVIKKGEPISVTNSVSEHMIKREYYFHLNKMNDYHFTPEFEQKLNELWIKI